MHPVGPMGRIGSPMGLGLCPSAMARGQVFKLTFRRKAFTYESRILVGWAWDPDPGGVSSGGDFSTRERPRTCGNRKQARHRHSRAAPPTDTNTKIDR